MAVNVDRCGSGTISGESGDQGGPLSLHGKEDVKNMVQAIDAVRTGGSPTSFMRSDGVLINAYRSERTGRVVIERPDGSWIAMCDDEARQAREALIDQAIRK